jgi:LemA protein
VGRTLIGRLIGPNVGPIDSRRARPAPASHYLARQQDPWESGDIMSVGAAAAAVGGVVCVLLVAVIAWAVITYNRLVRLRNQVDASWAQIDVQLKRRYDLIPNLVETVKGYAAHERGTLDAMAAAQTPGVADRAEAENMLTQTLGRLFALAEAYPDLKANQNFAALQAELANTEDKIAYARQFFNSAVQSFNTAVQTLPTNIIAGVGGFRSKDFFEAAGGERGPVQVHF